MEPSVFKAVEGAIFDAVRQNGSVTWNDLYNARGRICNSYADENLRTNDATLLPFELKVLRLAYIHLHCTIHAHMVKDFLGRFWAAKTEFRIWQSQLPGQLNVCCVGGGPGSDLLGLSLFLQNHQITVNRIHGDVLDRWTEWEDTFRTLIKYLYRPGFPNLSVGCMDVSYWDFDFHQNPQHANTIRIRQAHLVTMVKFVSAVSADRILCVNKLTILMRLMQEGALFFFLDNAFGGYAGIVHQAATAAGLQKIGEFNDVYVSLPQHETTLITASELNLPKIDPGKTWKVSASLWRKGDGFINNNSLVNLSRLMHNVSNIPDSGVSHPLAQPQKPKFTPQITNSNLLIHHPSPLQPAIHSIVKASSQPVHCNLSQMRTSQPSKVSIIPEYHIPQPQIHQPRTQHPYPAHSTLHQKSIPEKTATRILNAPGNQKTSSVLTSHSNPPAPPVEQETGCCFACLRCICCLWCCD